MTKPVPCPPAPGPLEEYAARFDDLFTRVAQRRGFREYLAGLLAPRDRNKTLQPGLETHVGARRGEIPPAREAPQPLPEPERPDRRHWAAARTFTVISGG